MLSAADLNALDFGVVTDFGLRDEAGVFVVFCDVSGDGKITGRPLTIEHAAKIRSFIRDRAARWMSECQAGSLLFAVQYVSDQGQREAIAQKLRRLNDA